MQKGLAGNMLIKLGMPSFPAARQLSFTLAIALAVSAQNAPPGAPPPDPARRIADIRRKLSASKPVDVTARRACSYSQLFLNAAQTENRAGHFFVADRHAEAADALFHVAEHQQHLRQGGGPAGPPPPAVISETLQQVYFRIQQADFFLKQANDARASTFPKWARDFYQLAVRAAERQDWIAAEENAHCSEEIVHALECLAQAAMPEETGPRPLLPPPPPLEEQP